MKLETAAYSLKRWQYSHFHMVGNQKQDQHFGQLLSSLRIDVNISDWLYINWTHLKIRKQFVDIKLTVFRPVYVWWQNRYWNFAQYNQQDATFHNLFISVRRCTRFRRFFRPSSGAQNWTNSVRYLSNHYCYLLLAFPQCFCVIHNL